jgi:2-polyprenyl-3-methyl-5-hydroxy-6-metoxy-1,4-benzoquinol methylase
MRDSVTDKNFNPSYVGPRPDIEQLISPDAKFVLDVGCSNGCLGGAIKAKTGAQVFGIELSQEMAKDARSRLDYVWVGDAAELMIQGKLEEYRFDTIVFADVLEHLVDPWAVLGAATQYLTPDGSIIASLPNIRHIDTLYHLIFKGYWSYRDRGIHDRTHLRFFTKQNIIELFEGAGLEIDAIETNYRILERPHRFNRFTKFLAFPGIKDFLAFQYLVKAHPHAVNDRPNPSVANPLR